MTESTATSGRDAGPSEILTLCISPGFFEKFDGIHLFSSVDRGTVSKSVLSKNDSARFRFQNSRSGVQCTNR